MITIRGRNPKRIDKIKGFDIPINTVFTADRVGSKGPGLYLRMGGNYAKGIVSLTDPQSFWTVDNPTVIGYKPVDIVIDVQ